MTPAATRSVRASERNIYVKSPIVKELAAARALPGESAATAALARAHGKRRYTMTGSR